MKLYATTTSERAWKGQGGNKYLSIEIKTDKTILTACFIEVIEKDEDNLYIKITGNGELRNGKTYTIPKEYIKISEIKGNKKKDDIANEESEENRYRKA